MTKKKSAAGRKKIDPSEVRIPVTIYVKKCNKPQAVAACAAIAARYR